jgi:hypothetical protein
MAEVTPNPVCLECNTEFLKTIERGAPRAYCLNCRPPKSLSKPLAKKVCPVCEEHFMGGGTRKYCSLECRNARINLDREARRTIARAATENTSPDSSPATYYYLQGYNEAVKKVKRLGLMPRR